MSPLSRLAQLLNVKEKVAWDFYLRVKNDFREHAPNIQAINQCIIENHLIKPTSDQVVRFFKKRGDLDEPDQGSIPSSMPPSENPPQSPFSTYKKQRHKEPSGDLRGYTGRQGALRPGRDARAYNKQIPHCPHGILLTKKCAICDPQGFAATSDND